VRVVVVDRSDPVRSRLVAHLREAGIAQIADASSLAEVPSLLAAFAPDAILADIVFPDAKPIEVVFALRGLAPAARLVIVSNEVHIRSVCLAGGAHAFFDKSKQLDELVASLRR
jgi:DNA-binding NarL/FixJ family response regulator